MKYILAAFSGIVASFLFYFIFVLILIKFNYEGFRGVASGAIDETQVFDVANKSILINDWIVLPLSVITAGIVSALIARTKEYLLGFICAIPIVAFSIYTGSYYSAVALLVSAFGVAIVKYTKRKNPVPHFD